MDAAGLDARLTKDLDIVLLAEALTPEFGHAFWRFVDANWMHAEKVVEEGAHVVSLVGHIIPS